MCAAGQWSESGRPGCPTPFGAPGWAWVLATGLTPQSLGTVHCDVPAGGLAAGAANDETGGESDRLGGPPLDAVDERAHRGPPQLACGLGDRGDRRIGVHEPRDVVERGQGDVLRYAQPTRAYGVQRAERHQVVGREDDLGRLGQVEEALGDPPPALGLEVALSDVGRSEERR